MTNTADLSHLPIEHRPITEIASLLRTAARIAERIEQGRYPEDRIDSAAWRAADALLLIREYTNERWPENASPGIHEPTRRGAQLAKQEAAA